MTEQHDEPVLDDVFEPTEHPIPHRSEHGKGYGRPDDEELERRVERERVALGIDDYDPNEVPPATD